MKKIFLRDVVRSQKKPELKTCNPGSMKFVQVEDAPQIVAEKNEVIFTYDVLFRVRTVHAVKIIEGLSPSVPMLIPTTRPRRKNVKGSIASSRILIRCKPGGGNCRAGKATPRLLGSTSPELP